LGCLKIKPKCGEQKAQSRLEIQSYRPALFNQKFPGDQPGALYASREWPVPVQSVTDISSIDKASIKFPRLAIYQSWRGNADEGWTRYMLDDLGFTYTVLHNQDFKGTKAKKVDLKANFDVIILASENPEIIKTGRFQRPGQSARLFMSQMPPEYEGGIGQEGVDALKAFVEAGGILVTLNQASELAMNELGAPARNSLSGVDRNKFFCPVSILRLKVDNTTPLGYGLGEEAAALFNQSLALDTWALLLQRWIGKWWPIIQKIIFY